MDLDTFFISVERLRNPELAGKPLIVGGKSNRGVVASCSYETRQFGVHSAMPIRQAKQLCPEALIISGDMEAYSQYSKMVTEIIRERAPMFEKSSIDEFYLDLTGMDKFFGCYKWSTELKETIRSETGLPISFGLSINKMVSKVATGESKPDGKKQIEKGTERPFLDPMYVSKIPMIGPKTTLELRQMGIQKVKTLRQMPAPLMQQVFGKNGLVLWQRANAIDETPVVPYTDAKSISMERTFDSDTMDTVALKAVLTSMVEKLAYKLRQDNRLTSCITVKIRYTNFDTFTKQAHIAYTSSDHTLIDKAKELFDRLFERRLLIRLIGVRFSSLVHGNYQINLFEDSEEIIRLYQAMDTIRNKYGTKNTITRARVLDTLGHRPMVNAFAKE